MKALIQNIVTKVRISESTQVNVTKSFNREELHQGHEVIKRDRTARKLYFIESGAFRTYYDHQDKDVTSCFYLEGQWMTTWHSFYTQQPSYESIEVLEDAVVYSINKDDLAKLISTNPQIDTFMRLMAEEQVSFMDAYFKGYMFMSATEKYNLLLTTYPTIENRVKLGYIASYLGISQETLSRIRKNKSA